MFLLYLDDAGSAKNRDEQNFILAGICIFERQIQWLSRELEKVAQRTGHPDPVNLELHGSEILAGRNWWRSMKKDQRRTVIRHGLAAARVLKGEWGLFAVVVNKLERSPEDPVEYAFEQLCNRFDRFLHRRYLAGKNDKGIIILDKSTRETRLQGLAANFGRLGHRWGIIRNLVDVPFFVDSKATRVVQFADLVAYALFRKFEKGDQEFFEVISEDFDTEGGVVHGFHHFKPRSEFCDCPACAPRLFP